jgi:hypothetical protein
MHSFCKDLKYSAVQIRRSVFLYYWFIIYWSFYNDFLNVFSFEKLYSVRAGGGSFISDTCYTNSRAQSFLRNLVPQLAKKFLAFYGTRKFVIVFTRTPLAPVQSTFIRFLRSTVILSCLLPASRSNVAVKWLSACYRFKRSRIQVSARRPAVLTGGFRWVPQSLQENVRVIPRISSRSLPSVSVRIHYSSHHLTELSNTASSFT